MSGLQTAFAKELEREAKWVMANTGSDAGEREVPGSKLAGQINRIARFADQYLTAEKIIEASPELEAFDLVRVTVTSIKSFNSIDPRDEALSNLFRALRMIESLSSIRSDKAVHDQVVQAIAKAGRCLKEAA